MSEAGDIVTGEVEGADITDTNTATNEVADVPPAAEDSAPAAEGEATPIEGETAPVEEVASGEPVADDAPIEADPAPAGEDNAPATDAAPGDADPADPIHEETSPQTEAASHAEGAVSADAPPADTNPEDNPPANAAPGEGEATAPAQDNAPNAEGTAPATGDGPDVEGSAPATDRPTGEALDPEGNPITPGNIKVVEQTNEQGSRKNSKESTGSLLRRGSKEVRRLSSTLKDWKSRGLEEQRSVKSNDTAGDEGNAENIPVENEDVIPVDFFYENTHEEFNQNQLKGELPNNIASFVRVSGFDFYKHYNLVWLNLEEFMYIMGHTVCIFNIITKQQQLLHGKDDAGIGWVSVSPHGDYLAVAEKSSTTPPRVFIYVITPSGEQAVDPRPYRILRNGTEKGYACCCFSPHDKKQMATLGKSPDYLLTIWNWKKESILLKCKAYGQDIFQVRWGQFPGQLITSGSGHIRFWKMATTFSGLKLQGALGKFGQAELSDMRSFIEMVDGKIITGSETGRLLVWEGVFVKCELVLRLPEPNETAEEKTARNPHQAQCDVVLIDKEFLVSAGYDGYLRWWSLADIDLCEADYDSGHIQVTIEMKDECWIPGPNFENYRPASIQHIATKGKIWLIQDCRNGCIWRFNSENRQVTQEIEAHAYAINGIAMCQSLPGLIITAGVDGSLRAHNYSEPFEIPGRQLVTGYPPKINDIYSGITALVPLPQVIDPEERTVICGYADGTVRMWQLVLGDEHLEFPGKFFLRDSKKPHNAPIKFLSFTSDGAWCVTATDQEFFLFEMLGINHLQMGPIGFMTLPVNMNTIQWNDETGNLLVSTSTGSLLEFFRPDEDDPVDTTESFEIKLSYRAITPEIYVEPPEEEEPIEDEDGNLIPPEPKEPPPNPNDEEGAVTHVVYLSDNVILFAGNGRYRNGLWEVTLRNAPFNTPDITVDKHTPFNELCYRRADLPKAEVTYMDISLSDNFLLLGFNDGRIWIIRLSSMSYYLEVRNADIKYGTIRSIVLSPNDQELIYAGGDGGIFTLNLNYGGMELVLDNYEGANEPTVDGLTMEELVESSAQPFPRYSHEEWDLMNVEDEQEAADITDPEHFTLQEEKLKLEEENIAAAAERQKRRVRERVKELRTSVEKIREDSLKLGLKVPESFFILDHDYVQSLVQDMGRQEELVRTKLAWDVEYHKLSIKKLKNHFLTEVDYDYSEVYGFREHVTSTFRTGKMSELLQEQLEKLHQLIFNESDLESEAEDGNVKNKGGRRLEEEDDMAELQPNIDLSNYTSLQIREHRKNLRMLRKQKMQELEKAKPSKDQGDDPRDIEAIQEAERTLGNYMLKTSIDYKVPENQRMNWEKKRRQMFLLEESIHAIKSEFNQRVLALRQFKEEVKKNLKKDLQSLETVEEQLGITSTEYNTLKEKIVQKPSITEYPENRLIISVEELDQQCEKMLGKEVADRVASVQVTTDPGAVTKGMTIDQIELRKAAWRVGAIKTVKEQKGKKEEAHKILLATTIYDEAISRLKFTRQQLIDCIEKVVEVFDDAVSVLSIEKMKLTSDLKTADMKLLTMYDELLLLNELEEKDCTLLKKANKCRQDKMGIIHQIKECQDSLNNKKLEIEEWQKEENLLQQEFTEMVGENSPFLIILLKIYRKKVKRSKRKKNINEDEDFDEDEDDEDEESDLDSDEDEDDMEEDICPQGCDMSIYESIIELRDKRLDMEDALIEIQKAVEELKKNHQRLLMEERRIDKDEKITEKDIQKFQTEKQHKLNQIGIVFELRLHQFQCLDDNGKIPHELEEHVVFTQERLEQLRNRITQLHQEKIRSRQNYKQLQRDYVTRNKEKQGVQAKIEELEERNQDIQILKFGQTVNLELLEKNTPNKYVRELEEKVNELEKNNINVIKQWKRKVSSAQEILYHLTQENSSFMNQIVNMGYSQLQLDTTLNTRIANVTVNDQEPTMELKELEHERIKDLLTLQTKEITTLQSEINIFRKKGGHIYTTVTANRLPEN